MTLRAQEKDKNHTEQSIESHCCVQVDRREEALQFGWPLYPLQEQIGWPLYPLQEQRGGQSSNGKEPAFSRIDGSFWQEQDEGDQEHPRADEGIDRQGNGCRPLCERRGQRIARDKGNLFSVAGAVLQECADSEQRHQRQPVKPASCRTGGIHRHEEGVRCGERREKVSNQSADGKRHHTPAEQAVESERLRGCPGDLPGFWQEQQGQQEKEDGSACANERISRFAPIHHFCQSENDRDQNQCYTQVYTIIREVKSLDKIDAGEQD